MNKITTIVIFIFVLTSCVQPKYFVKTERDLLKIDWNQNHLNYIPLSENYLNKSTVLNTTYNLISLKKLSKLKKYLSSVNERKSDFYLANALYYISILKYKEAANNLTNVESEKFKLIKDLLFIDLSYELAKQNGTKNFKYFIKKYQKVMDKYPDSKYLKNIIKLRIKYVRYNY